MLVLMICTTVKVLVMISIQKPTTAWHVRRSCRWWGSRAHGLAWSRSTPSWERTVTRSAGLPTAFPVLRVRILSLRFSSCRRLCLRWCSWCLSVPFRALLLWSRSGQGVRQGYRGSPLQSVSVRRREYLRHERWGHASSGTAGFMGREPG